MTCGRSVEESRIRCLRRDAATLIIIASAAAVAPSYMEALAQSIPVREQTMLWNSKIYRKVPWEISAWYGV